MEILFGEVFINEIALKDEGINYPIKVEYFKRVNGADDVLGINKARYGINIVKTEYQNEKTVVEKRGIMHFTNDEQRVNSMLETLKENVVTPVALDDVVCDISKNYIFN